MKQLAQVIMLPTEDSSKISLHQGKLHFTPRGNKWKHKLAQHLYITSDEEIKEGDHVLLKYPNGYEVKQMIKGVAFENAECINNENKFHNCGHKKIIATTDNSLTNVAQISQSFIEEYCDKGGIDKVMVKYFYEGERCALCGEGKESQCVIPNSCPKKYFGGELKLKVNPDSTINIFPIKDTWNKEELIPKFKHIFIQGGKCGNDFKYDFDLDNWIKENL